MEIFHDGFSRMRENYVHLIHKKKRPKEVAVDVWLKEKFL